VAGIAASFKIIDISGCGFIIWQQVVLNQKNPFISQNPVPLSDKPGGSIKMVGGNPAGNQVKGSISVRQFASIRLGEFDIS
jgi:hypothetical protein